ncbi:uncharacterized protein LOC132740261 isoform X2 [Ruditapes philippinarum]|uniref:uncharacterized protein LOC132740261 isoform X2 n=1 Tax=Ruditapes philippinarum TaxID=129788 RepID=UPI00295B32C9|nr:uncharacterized protein LOC132740261 isoform X2 [Ruditapes philippinarum]
MTVKVWNSDKTRGKVLTVRSFEDLVSKVREKFEIRDDRVTMVLEDNCEIDDNDGLNGLCGEHSGQISPSLYFLIGNEQLLLPSGEQSRFNFLMEQMKRKRGLNNETRQKKGRLTMKVCFGWMHFNPHEKRYVAVRSQKGGGSKKEEILRSATYDLVLEKLLNIFFPDGKSALGRISKFHQAVGDGRGNAIKKENFSLEDIESSSKENRLYLLTKEKVIHLETDSDSDFELPDIQFRTARTQPVTEHSGPQHNLATQSVTPQQPAVFQSNTSQPVTHQSLNVALMSAMQTPPGHVATGTPTVTFNPETLKCCVCYERDRSAFLIPCGHLYCMVCATHLESTQMSCAVCRTSITGVGRLHA